MAFSQGFNFTQSQLFGSGSISLTMVDIHNVPWCLGAQPDEKRQRPLDTRFQLGSSTGCKRSHQVLRKSWRSFMSNQGPRWIPAVKKTAAQFPTSFCTPQQLGVTPAYLMEERRGRWNDEQLLEGLNSARCQLLAGGKWYSCRIYQ